MNEGLIPARYAKALYKVAVERKCDRRMYELMQNLASAFEAGPEIGKTVANPFVSDADKTSLLMTAAAADPKKDPTFVDFVKLLETKRRISMADSIAIAYIGVYRRANDIRNVSVISAAPLDPEVEKRIRSVIERHLNGAKMEFSAHVDPELIGGFVVNIDNERLDASLRNSLKELRLNLLK